MEKYCDLHTHSYYSDGTASPARIISEACGAGLSAVALTDHNTVAGLPEFLSAAEGANILAIPGIEISTGYLEKEVHIVGLFLEPKDFGTISDFLSILNIRKEASNRALIHALSRAGYPLDYGRIKADHAGSINRAVIAAEMLKKGYIASIQEGFRGLLSPSGGYYTPPERISSFEAIAFLRALKAVPVLAHPFLDFTEEELLSFLPKAKDCGLIAMETQYATYSEKTAALAAKIAKDHGLLESGGSDYHGNNKPDIQLGRGRGDLQVSHRILETLLACKAAL